MLVLELQSNLKHKALLDAMSVAIRMSTYEEDTVLHYLPSSYWHLISVAITVCLKPFMIIVWSFKSQPPSPLLHACSSHPVMEQMDHLHQLMQGGPQYTVNIL